MTGLFHTSTTSAPLVFEAAGMQCTKASVGSMDNNAYLLDAGGPLLLIDAPDEAERLLALLDGRPLAAVVTTHRHPDHLQALAEVVRRTGATAYAGGPDASAIEQQTGVASRRVWTGDRIECDGIRLEVVGLVGHTPGSVALVLHGVDGSPTHIFSGDSLFPGGVGKTSSPADFASLLGEVTSRLFDRFADDTVIHPGHGDATTLGAERPHLKQWQARGW